MSEHRNRPGVQLCEKCHRDHHPAMVNQDTCLRGQIERAKADLAAATSRAEQAARERDAVQSELRSMLETMDDLQKAACNINLWQAELAAALQRAEQAEQAVLSAKGEGQTLGNRIVLLTAERDTLSADLAAAQCERDKLQAFKDWVHSYLDAHHVPHHPPGTHGAEGCRIGDRLDWLFAERETLLRERNDLATRGNLAVRERNAQGARAERAEADLAAATSRAEQAERDAARGERDRLLEALGILERRLEIRGPHNTEDGRSTWICEICRAVREDSRSAKHGAGCPFAARAALEKEGETR